jgi:hypothetical protein
MNVAAIGLYLLFLVVAFGARTIIQWRRTGNTGLRLHSPRPACEVSSCRLAHPRSLTVVCGLVSKHWRASMPSPALGSTVHIGVHGPGHGFGWAAVGRASGWGWPVIACRAVATARRSALM